MPSSSRWRPRVAPTRRRCPSPRDEPAGARRRRRRSTSCTSSACTSSQYRHATRSPEPYWREALRRDPGDYRSNLALAGAALPGRAVRRGRAAPAGSARPADPSEREPGGRRGDLPPRPGARAHRSPGRGRTRRAARRGGTRRGAAPALLAMARLDAARGRDRSRPRPGRRRPPSTRTTCRPGGARRPAAARRPRRRRGRRAGTALALDPLDVWTRDLARSRRRDGRADLLDVALEYARVGGPEAARAARGRRAGGRPRRSGRRRSDRSCTCTPHAILQRPASTATPTGTAPWRGRRPPDCFAVAPRRRRRAGARRRADPDRRPGAGAARPLAATPRAAPTTRSRRGARRPQLDPSDPVVWRNLGSPPATTSATPTRRGRVRPRARGRGSRRPARLRERPARRPPRCAA